MDDSPSPPPFRPLPPPFVPRPPRDRPPPLPPVPGRPTSLWQETLDEHRNTATQDESSYGGVLIFVGICRVLAIPMALFAFLRLWGTYSTPGLWSKLTSVQSSHYQPLWAVAIVYELAGQALIFGCSLVLAWLYFARKQTFRLAIVVYSLALLVYLWGDHFLATSLRVAHNAAATNSSARLIGYTLGTMIWVPYYLMSERMREVFVR